MRLPISIKKHSWKKEDMELYGRILNDQEATTDYEFLCKIKKLLSSSSSWHVVAIAFNVAKLCRSKSDLVNRIKHLEFNGQNDHLTFMLYSISPINFFLAFKCLNCC